MKRVSCRIFTVGNELLIGETVDTNSAAMARGLAACGVEVVRKEALPDDVKVIADAVNSGTADITLLTGGLGPTPDDLTRDALASAFGVPLREDKRQVRRIKSFFKKFRRKAVACNFVQAQVPLGFRAINNDFGTAPVLFREKPFIAALPGVPRELERLMPAIVVPLIRKNFACPRLYIEEIRTTGIGESMLYDRIRRIPIPRDVSFASLPESGGVVIRLLGRDRNLIAGIAGKIRARVAGFVYGGRGESLESALLKTFVRGKLTLALAESCTGGLISSRITSVPGSSKYFLGGVVSYGNTLKEKFLGVSREVLKEKGAVSGETALSMARGIRERACADIGAAVTGIAGPNGGTKEKPVGTVFIAVVSDRDEIVEPFRFFGGRKGVQERSAAAAMFLALKMADKKAGHF
jgi:nicotinamide-nucleotide amidase